MTDNIVSENLSDSPEFRLQRRCRHPRRADGGERDGPAFRTETLARADEKLIVPDVVPGLLFGLAVYWGYQSASDFRRKIRRTNY
jgi:hypothetical protein